MKPIPNICQYCENAPAEGFVPAYEAYICEDCYEEHHGED